MRLGHTRSPLFVTLIGVLLGLTLVLVDAPNAAAAPCDPPITNPIVCENSKPGNPTSEWDISGAGDASIQGFATDMSVDQGQTVSFKIDTNSSNYRLDIYRLGYYGGLGARKIATVQPSAALPQNQPACLYEEPTGLVDCGNWGISASWAVPASAVSGIYIAKLVREDVGGDVSSHITFIVRDDDGHSPILLQTSDTTWQAYNSYGGNSFYLGLPVGRAYKLSYNRPFVTRDGSTVWDWLFSSEYPMVRFLEANGYNVSYFTGVDSDRRGAEILEHELFLSVGHDEYWSGPQRSNLEAARDAGVNLAFFSGNEVYWKTRWETSIDGSGTPYRTLVCYKETWANSKIDPLQDVWTGTWRDPRFSPPADGGLPENALTGTMFSVNRGYGGWGTAIQVPAAEGKMRFWRNTSVANLSSGQVATLENFTLGYEWDEDLDNGFRPAGIVHLSSTTEEVPEKLLDFGSTVGVGVATHTLTLYKATSGALVFAAGTVQWPFGLDSEHDGPSTSADVRMQQATVNLFGDMGVQPGSLRPGLVAASPSSDTVAPTSIITSPASNTTVPQGQVVPISGTASDSGGGRVGGVEVSLDNGATWHPASGRENWTFSWTPNTPGTATVRSRAVDDSANLGNASSSRTITVEPRTCPCTIWSQSATPDIASAEDPFAIELGVKFRADVDGYVTGIRFYKGPDNTGTHIGNLWTANGLLQATGTFVNESSNGWQQLNFPSPVPISANVTYVASYHSDVGSYALTGGEFITSVDSYPLHALSSAAAGGNGVYRYGGSAFPNQPSQATNYWIDVVFETTANDTIPPTVIDQSPTSGALQVAPTTTVTATFNEPVNASSITFELRAPGNQLVPGAVSYDSATRVATLTPNAVLAESTTYAVAVRDTEDLSQNVMAPVSWSFTTTGPATSLWVNSPTPTFIAVSDPYAVELGVKVRSDVDGFINGIRFYKGSTNVGPHIANLWSESGALVATATFTDESASGWQQVLFPAPVPIGANTTYVASYHTESGFYSVDQAYFVTGVDSYPLHALSNAEAGGNGLYKYGPSGFPTGSYSASNYWVDVVFSQIFFDNVPPAVLSQSPASGSDTAAPTTTVTATFSEPVLSSSVSFVLRTAAGSNVPGSITYDAATQTAIFTPISDLEYGAGFTATVSGARDVADNPMTAPVSWSFTTVACPCTIWPASATPATPNSGDTSAIELGVQFRSDVSGFITG
ncbi:MAG TPA: DUF4082 domain-containing protein, partial [Dehalococcoidia bacterium]|nr:DUF4082 domain-containing protein [Dehalococcoidia bacterium]